MTGLVIQVLQSRFSAPVQILFTQTLSATGLWILATQTFRVAGFWISSTRTFGVEGGAGDLEKNCDCFTREIEFLLMFLGLCLKNIGAHKLVTIAEFGDGTLTLVLFIKEK